MNLVNNFREREAKATSRETTTACHGNSMLVVDNWLPSFCFKTALHSTRPTKNRLWLTYYPEPTDWTLKYLLFQLQMIPILGPNKHTTSLHCQLFTWIKFVLVTNLSDNVGVGCTPFDTLFDLCIFQLVRIKTPSWIYSSSYLWLFCRGRGYNGNKSENGGKTMEEH